MATTPKDLTFPRETGIIWSMSIHFGKNASLRSHIGRFGAAAGLFLAVSLAAVAVAGSFLIPTKPLGVGVAAVGCFAAGWLFASFYARLNECATPSLQGELERERREVKAASKQIAALEADNARLKNQRIDINSFSPILKLGLAEADMSVRDVKIEWMDDFKPGNMLTNVIGGPIRSKYIGVVERSFRAIYGVDLMKLKICEDSDCIRVAGIVPESIGIKDDETRWLLRQTQTYRLRATSLTYGEASPQCASGDGWGDGERFWQIDKTVPFEGSLDLNKTAAMADAQERELGERINRGQGAEFKIMNGYIQQMAEGVVRLLLAPTKKTVIFVETPLAEIVDKDGWLSLENFAAAFNNRPLGTYHEETTPDQENLHLV